MAKKLIKNTMLIWYFKPKIAMAQFAAGFAFRAKCLLIFVLTLPFTLFGLVLNRVGAGIVWIVNLTPAPCDERYSRLFRICTKAYKNKLVREKTNG